MSSAQSAPQSESQAAERVVRILEVVADASHPMTVAEIAEEMGLHRSIIYRFLRTLQRTRLVAQASDGRFTLGHGITALAMKVSHDAAALMRPRLQQLADACEATAFITQLVGDHTECLMSVEPVISRTHLIFRPGTIGPVDRGAPVIAIRVASGELNLEGAAEALSNGYAWSTGAITPGVESIAAAIALPAGHPPSAVAVIYPQGSRLIEEVAQEVTATAESITGLFIGAEAAS